MASSKIDLSNSALLKVGARKINSFSDNKVEAQIVQQFYQRSYDFLLSSFYWGFAMKSEALAQGLTPPVAEYKYAFQLPVDVIRVQRVFPNSNYKIVGNELHTNQEAITLKYTRRVPEEDLPIYFEQAFMYYLAEQITIPITENQQKSNANYEKALYHLKMAKSQDSQQYPQDGFQDFPLENARFGGY